MPADYKTKYLDLRAKLIESTDAAFRLGFEQGIEEGQKQAQQQQMAMEQAMMQQQAAAAQGEEGMPPEEGGQMPEEGGEEMPPEEGGEPMPEEMGEETASELDEHMDALGSLVAKGAKPSVVDLRKKVNEIMDLRKAQKNAWKKKNSKTTSAQKRLVDDILKKWEKETKDVTENITEEIAKEKGIKLGK